MYEVGVVRNRINIALDGDVMLVFLWRLWYSHNRMTTYFVPL